MDKAMFHIKGFTYVGQEEDNGNPVYPEETGTFSDNYHPEMDGRNDSCPGGDKKPVKRI